jgi:hypothetical protein
MSHDEQSIATILAQLVQARRNCLSSGNSESWAERHEGTILAIVAQCFPHGSGFDSGTKIDLDESTDEKLVFHTSFHHMGDNGLYIGWTYHKVVVRGSLASGFVIKITGQDKCGIKEYIHEHFYSTLETKLTREKVATYQPKEV